MRTAPGAQTIFPHALSALLLVWSALSCGSAAIGFAQTVAPITSSGLNTNVTKSGPSFDITGGTRPGNGGNLFHSFGRFDVPEHSIANFVNDSGLATTNILSRITGGSPSNIFGTLQTTGFAGANLFLMNPAGIVFGPTASLNVGGSVHITSADYLRLADGGRFTALPGPSDAAISSAPVAAFGFLGSNPGALTLQGGQLTVPDGAGLSFVGGNISIQAGALGSGVSQPASLTAPGGAIALASVRSSGEVDVPTALSTPQPLTGFTTLGDITLSSGTKLQTDAATAGRIIIRAGQFTTEQASLTALSTRQLINTTNPSETRPTISLTADSITLKNGTFITADSTGTAPAGLIELNTRLLTSTRGPIRLQVFPESLITGETFSQTGVLIESTSRSTTTEAGPSGHIRIQGPQGSGSVAEQVTLEDTILHTRSFGGTGSSAPGTITITSESLALSNQVEIYTTSNGPAPGGNVALNVGELRSNVDVDGSFLKGSLVYIGSPTEKPDRTAGPAGSVTISGVGPQSTDSAKRIVLSNTEIDTFAVDGASPQRAPIILNADTISLNNNTLLVTTSGAAAPAAAGDIVLNANKVFINMNPDGTPNNLAARVYLNSPSGRLDADAGHPGTITISGPNPESTDPAQLVGLNNAQMSTAVEGGAANLRPGIITITADTVSLQGRSRIFAFSTSAAPAGDLALHVNTLLANSRPDGSPIFDGAQPSLLSSVGNGDTPTAGRAGTVTISGIGPEATDPAHLLALNNVEVKTNILGGAASTRAASITMTADTIRITNSPNIRTDTTGDAPGGHIAFHTHQLTMDQNTHVSSQAFGTGPSGTVTMQARDFVSLSNGSSISASSTGPANAGNITINAGAQFLSRNSSVTTEASRASGGNISILATDAIRLINSQLSTSVKGGPSTAGGNIVLDPAVVTLQNSQVRADAVQGQGGNVNIIAGAFLSDQSSVVSASSEFGLSGTVTIQSPTSGLSQTMTILPHRPLSAQPLLRQRCAAQAGGQFSSFVLAHGETVPSEPGHWLISALPPIADEPAIASGSQRAGDDQNFQPQALALTGIQASQLDLSPPGGVYDTWSGCGS